jgi:alginate O-acetyltransferase complex protein AlgI
MLFNSYIFILLFLPIVIGIYHALAHRNFRLSLGWLTASSLLFYAWWNPTTNLPWSPVFLLLLVGSALGNFLLGRAIENAAELKLRKAWLWSGVAGNLGLIAYFKYRGLFSELWSLGSGGVAEVVMPLAISFYTFIQIAYLVDVSRGGVPRYTFGKYLLFVVFFPHLIAGPIVHHGELIPQFQRPRRSHFWRYISIGSTMLVIGLFKKVVIADALARGATPLFDLAASGERPLTFVEGWVASLSYTTQLYFDFSGYSDMAIGLSFMFGIRLPLNFDSPYKATSIVDFWKRWHITLSRFLRDYLYIPIGGNRKGPIRRYSNLLITMLLGGLWHGAGISYILWGFIHGAFICLNHFWFGFRERFRIPAMPRFLAIALTFLIVLLAWVPFRAGSYELQGGNFGVSLEVTGSIYASMFGLNGFEGWPPDGTAVVKSSRIFRMLVAALIIVWLLPNTQQWMGAFSPHLGRRAQRLSGFLGRLRWRPTFAWLLISLGLLYAVGSELGKFSEFIYYQF